ncbi:MAG: DUF3365 domain-containing protein [Nitrospira sp.]|nr:DUF3365 domain-containing protein [Nitrospira sp.]MCP9461773.1 DUF3365 domain-containing protein [Nitrospira sp.]MCP9473730.1 DUF3365 domain-containing protein [Nitrospira sp.]
MGSIRITIRIAVCAFVTVGCLWSGASFLHAKETLGADGIPPDKVADYIHAILEANRTVYTTSIVNRLQEKGLLSATEHWEQDNTLPLPAQLLQHTGRIVAESGRGIRFRLIGLSPIYQRNAPATQFERQALETLRKRPDQPVTGIVTSGKKRYFQAIYADRAVSPACVSCHNTHPLSPKQDFKLNDVMGAIAITIPLE